MKIFVTGGTGRVGSKVVELLLKNKHQVILLTQSRKIDGCENVEGDLFSFDVTRMKGCDAVVHIAGLVKFNSREELFRINVEGTREMVRLANQFDIPHFIHISSISVYGKRDNENITEKTKLYPDTLYAQSKLASEHELEKFKGIKCILRPGMIYGPMFTEGFDMALKMIKKGKFYVFGNGNNYVPLVSIDLVAQVILFCLERKIEGIYNVIDNEKITQNEVLNYVAKLTNSQFKIVKFPFFISSFLIYLYNLISKNIIPYEYIQMLNTNRKVDSQLYHIGFKTKYTQREKLKEFVELLNVK